MLYFQCDVIKDNPNFMICIRTSEGPAGPAITPMQLSVLELNILRKSNMQIRNYETIGR
jgi:hypothetical protein